MELTIITVVLNDLKNLKKTAKSLKSQSNFDFQWIIKDGISNDGTVEFVKSMQYAKNLNINYYSKKDISLYDAMNQSLEYIKGKYVLFLNAGDVLFNKDVVDATLKEIKKSEEFFFFYGDNYDLTINNISIYKKSRDFSYLKKSLPTSHQAIFYKSSLFNKYKYSLKYKVAADYALTAQIYFDGFQSSKYLDFAVCIFSLDGFSHNNRLQLLKEGYQIHRKIVKKNWLFANFMLVIRCITFYIHDNFPNLYKKIRSFFDNI